MLSIFEEHDMLTNEVIRCLNKGNETDIQCAYAALEWFYQEYPEFRDEEAA